MRVSARWAVAAALVAAASQAQAQLPITNGLGQATAFEDSYGTGRLIEGGYQIAARQGLTRWFWYNGFIPSSARISVTMTLRGGPNGEFFGLTFGRGSRDVAQWASFMIDADGHYKMVKWGGDDGIPLRTSSAIRTGIGSRNELSVAISGQNLTFYINGTQVETFYADRDASGYIGVEVSQGMEVRFENLTAYALGSVPMPVAAPLGDGGKGMAVATPGTGGGSLLWSDDFSTFSVADGDIARSEYSGGGLLVTARQGMTRWLFGRGLAPANARISMNVQFRGGPSNAKFGIAFGRQSRDEAAWMVFDVTADGQYYVEGYGATNNLGPMPSPAVMRGYNAINQIAVEVRGSQLTLYVNGQYVGNYTSTRTAAGYVGVHASAGSQVLFTNLRVEQLN